MGGKEIRSAVAEFVDIDGILAAQDEAGVDRVLLCPWVPLLYYDAEPDEGLRAGADPERGTGRGSCGPPRAASRRSARCRSRIPSWRPASSAR